MIEIRRILCPVDFSDFSKRALDHAVAISRWYNSAVTVLHVRPSAPVVAYSPAAAIPSAGLTPAEREALSASVRRFAEIEVGAKVPIDVEIAEGNVANEILTRAEAVNADLLVLGTHGRSGFERFVLGSVTEKVLRKASCPVLSVPRGIADAVPAAPVLFKRIVCAVDFSDCSMHALNYAMSIAQEADAQLTVIHTVEVPSNEVLEEVEAARGGSYNLKDYVRAAQQERQARLDGAVPDAVRTYCRVETLIAVGRPYREILRVAKERESDLIVIGIHGRGAADLLFFGSTAQHVVREASCPVLTLRRD